MKLGLQIMKALGFHQSRAIVGGTRDTQAQSAHPEPVERPIEAWMEAKTGKDVAHITTRDVLGIPRRGHLVYAEMKSKLGGRLDDHLTHLPPEQAKHLEERGDAFLEATATDGEP